MTEPRTQRRVLLVGGHLDGQWVDVDQRERTHRVFKPMALDYKTLTRQAGDVSIPVPEYVDYRIERMPIAIRDARADIWIGTAFDLYGPRLDRAIARALFQRDVAALFKGTW